MPLPRIPCLTGANSKGAPATNAGAPGTAIPPAITLWEPLANLDHSQTLRRQDEFQLPILQRLGLGGGSSAARRSFSICARVGYGGLPMAW